MKKKFLYGIVVIICIYLLFSCGNKKSDELIYDIKLKIVSINSDGDYITQDKFHTPKTCNIVLFETIGDNKMYCELNTCRLDFTEIRITTEWLYNHRAGDIVHFDYLRKDRFFKINPR